MKMKSRMAHEIYTYFQWDPREAKMTLIHVYDFQLQYTCRFYTFINYTHLKLNIHTLAL